MSSFAQFIFGFLIGVLILTGAGAATAYWFFNRMSDVPPKPNVSEESSETASQDKSSQSSKQQQPSQTKKQEQPSASTKENASTQAEQTSSDKPEQSQSNASQPESEPTIKERFGQQAYKARVTWPEGLSLRDRPSVNASRVGGVYYDDKLVIVGTSGDGDWQQVYVPESGQKAWVKAGNVEKIN